MADKSNRELVEGFFELITKGVFATDEAGVKLTGDAERAILMATKKWRNQVWVAFYEIEERLVPRPPNAPRPDYVKKIIEKTRG